MVVNFDWKHQNFTQGIIHFIISVCLILVFVGCTACNQNLHLQINQTVSDPYLAAGMWWLLFSLGLTGASSFYIPLIAPVEYSRGQTIEIKVSLFWTSASFSLTVLLLDRLCHCLNF